MKNLMSLRTCRPFQAVLCSLILAGLGLAPRALAQATANPPERINYQGYLTDATGTALGATAPKNYDLVFRIYDASTGGTKLWTEQQTVTVDKGNYSLLLGEGADIGETRNSLSTVFDSATASDRYIEVTVKGITAGVDATLAPRLRMVPTAYAFLAAKATTAVTASSVDGAGVTTGTIADARLSANIPKLASANTFTAAQTISGTLTATTLGVTGAATVGTTLGVTGATTLSGNAVVGGTLGVTGAATVSATLAVTGNTTVGNTAAGVLSAPYSALVNIPYVVLAEYYATFAAVTTKASIAGLNVRDFNTVQTDTHNLCILNQNVSVATGGMGGTSVTGSTFILKAGTYRCDIFAPAYTAMWHKLRLYNVTSSAVLVTGPLVYSYAGTSNVDYQDGIYPARLVGQFTLSADTTLRVDHFVHNGWGTGLRNANASGTGWTDGISVFAVAQFWKVQ